MCKSVSQLYQTIEIERILTRHSSSRLAIKFRDNHAIYVSDILLSSFVFDHDISGMVDC